MPEYLKIYQQLFPNGITVPQGTQSMARPMPAISIGQPVVGQPMVIQGVNDVPMYRDVNIEPQPIVDISTNYAADRMAQTENNNTDGSNRKAFKDTIWGKNLNLQTGLAAGAGIAGAALNTINDPNLTNLDATNIFNQNKAVGNQNMMAGDTTQLAGLTNNMRLAGSTNYNDLMPSGMNRAKGYVSAIGAGAAAGSVAGPIGTIVGGAIGAAGAGIKDAFSWAGAKSDANKANLLAQENNARALNNLDISSNQVSENNYYNMAKQLAEGGMLFNTHGGVFNPMDIRLINSGGTHEENPNGGVMQGVDPQGVPNLVEEGEVVYNNYVFSNRLKPSKRALKDAKLSNSFNGKTYAEIAQKFTDELDERPDDAIAKRTVENKLQKLMMTQETQKMRAEMNKQMAENEQQIQSMFACGGKMANVFAPGGPLTQKYIDGLTDVRRVGRAMRGYDTKAQKYVYYDPVKLTTIDPNGSFERTNEVLSAREKATDEALARIYSQEEQEKEFNELLARFDAEQSINDEKFNREIEPYFSIEEQEDPKVFQTISRYAPAMGNLISAISSAFVKPDYSDVNNMVEAAYARPREVMTRPIGEYMRYNPTDVNVALNALNSQAAATNRALRNNPNAGAVAASLLAAGANQGNATGQTLLQGIEYNDKLYNQVVGQHNTIDQYNSQNGSQTDSFNTTQDAQYKRNLALTLGEAAKQKMTIKNVLDTQKSANISNFLTSLGNIGTENWRMNNINTNQANRGYQVDWNGLVSYLASQNK